MKSYKYQKALERSWNHPLVTRAQTVMSQTQSLPLHTTEGGGTPSLHQGTFLLFPKHRHQEVKNNRQQEFKPCWLTVWLHNRPITSQAGPDSAVVFISNVQLKKSIIPIKSCSSPLTPFKKMRNFCWNCIFHFGRNHESILNSHLYNTICTWEIHSLGLKCTIGHDWTLVSFLVLFWHCTTVSRAQQGGKHLMFRVWERDSGRRSF